MTDRTRHNHRLLTRSLWHNSHGDSPGEVLLHDVLQPEEDGGRVLAPAALEVGLDGADARRVLLVMSDLKNTLTTVAETFQRAP